MERKHSDVLVAGLILIGATMSMFIVVHEFSDTDWLTRSVVWCAGAFVATQIARRALVGLTLGQTAIAATVAVTLVQGIFAERRGEPMQAMMLLPIGLATLGALGGALTSQHPRPEPALAWRVAAAGFAPFGAILLAGLITQYLDVGYDVLVTLVGAALASLLVALRIEIMGWHCALGLAIVFVASGAVDGDANVAVFGALTAAGIAAIGGRIGAGLRVAREPKPALPEAQAR